MDFSLEGTYGEYLKDLPTATLALSIVLIMTVVLRWLSRCKIPSIPIQMMVMTYFYFLCISFQFKILKKKKTIYWCLYISWLLQVGIFLGKSILGRKEISGNYFLTYETLFSIQNQTVIFHIGAFGYLTSVFLIGLKTNLAFPKRSELLLGLIGVLVPFFIGLFIEFFFESKLKLRTAGFKGYGILIFSLSSPSFPSISLLLHDLNLSTESLSQFILSTSLIAEVATDAFTEILKVFYDRHSHISLTSTDAFYPLLCLFFFLLFAFLFFRPLINLLSKYSSFSHSSVLIIFILTAVGLCNTILSDFATGHGIFITLILGLAVPCFTNLQEMIDQIEELVKVFLFLYISSLTLTVNVFCINFKKKETILCGILLLGVTTSRLFTVIIMSRKLRSCTWREAWATGLMMTPLGFVELSVFAVARYENVRSCFVSALVWYTGYWIWTDSFLIWIVGNSRLWI